MKKIVLFIVYHYINIKYYNLYTITMDIPFKYISATSAYNLKYIYNQHKSIDQCIIDTAVYYDQNTVTDVQFKQMIQKITIGGSNSPITKKICVNYTVQALCIYYPKHLIATHITSLIGCMDSTNGLSIEYIEGIGYKFTSAQIKYLNTAGILMMDKLESMSLNEFYSFFSNESFKCKINKNWNDDPDKYVSNKQGIQDYWDEHNKNKKENSQIKDIVKDTTCAPSIYGQIKVLNDIIKKFNIQLDHRLWDHLLEMVRVKDKYYTNYKKITINSLLNLHRVVIALGVGVSRVFLDMILKEYTIISYIKSNDNRLFGEILNYYKVENQDLNFNRNNIFEYIDGGSLFNTILYVIESEYCSYNMLRDLYYWINSENYIITDYICKRVIALNNEDLFMHISSMYHIPFKEFNKYIELNFNCGWDDEEFIKILLSFVYDNNKFISYYVDNKLIITKQIIDYVWKRDTVETIYDNCVTYTENSFSETIKHNYENKLLTDIRKVRNCIDSKKIYRVFKSMNQRDRRIYSHYVKIKISYITDIQYILRYDVKLTKSHLEYIIGNGYEDVIIRLLHISSKYDYLIDMMDLDLVVKCMNHFPRLWFHKNIIIPQLVDGLDSSELSFCRFDSENFIFNTSQNEETDSDIGYNIIDKFSQIETEYKDDIRKVQEHALSGILTNDT
jgi:hypothetical protein